MLNELNKNHIMNNLLAVISFFLLFSSSAFSQSTEILLRHAVSFEDRSELTALTDAITTERLVLMGEASHGTSEFYTKRAAMSKHLASERGFNFIAVEGDWSALSKINEYVKHKPGGPASLDDAMGSIQRWPLWMWRNQEFKNLVEWLHQYNLNLPSDERVGLYGIDVYDHEASMQDVVEWLTEMDSSLGRNAQRAYSCMTRHADPGSYVQMVARTGQHCGDDIERVLEMVQSLHGADGATDWGYFRAEQGAKVAVNAELHYRSNLDGGAASWNHRASHFFLTAERLLEHYGENSRGIIWAHNTHIGDARATDMGRMGVLNIGQMSREAMGDEHIFAVGFGTYTGQVLAASRWEGDMQRMEIPDAQPGSWEHTLMETGLEKLYLIFNEAALLTELQNPVSHRAIGVTYNPAADQGNYVPSLITDRYDAFIFIHTTGVLTPLD